ncbi:MAG TPA: N-acetyltransferase [Gammaproteobacteria bacterium]|nr:N-acetyltransferase [Gammaproteobacteria bacterium]
MKYKWKYNLDEVDLGVLSELYRIAPLGEKTAEDLAVVFDNSRYRCFVYSGDQLTGAGRALADGRDCSYICDVAVHPEFQGQGLGIAIINKLVEFSKGHKKIILYTVPGKEAFYNRAGFIKMNTAMAIFEDQQQAIELGILCANEHSLSG